MNRAFHQTAPVIALKLLPKSIENFLITDTYTIENLMIDADLPDTIDHDNIIINAEIHHAHSYKLIEVNGNLKWQDGDCLERLKGLCSDAHDFKAEGKLDMVRYCFAKMTHYKIDSLTYPHLHKGKPWSTYHVTFETELGKYINNHKDEIGNFNIDAYKDIYSDSRKCSLQMWYEGKNIVEKYENKILLTDEEKLSICNTSVKGICDLWTTLAKEFKFYNGG